MSKVITITDENQFNQLIADNNKVVLDFFAEWCGPCKMLLPVLDEVSLESSDIVFCKVNVDENSDFARKHNVRSIPTVLYYSNGEVVDRTMGFYPKEQLMNQLTKAYKPN